MENFFVTRVRIRAIIVFEFAHDKLGNFRVHTEQMPTDHQRCTPVFFENLIYIWLIWKFRCVEWEKWKIMKIIMNKWKIRAVVVSTCGRWTVNRIYSSIGLKLCGFAYKLFEHLLGIGQYFPVGAVHSPENRLFRQFHASQTPQMKEEILRQLCSKASTIRVFFLQRWPLGWV